jgi:hypothetical protein
MSLLPSLRGGGKGRGWRGDVYVNIYSRVNECTCMCWLVPWLDTKPWTIARCAPLPALLFLSPFFLVFLPNIVRGDTGGYPGVALYSAHSTLPRWRDSGRHIPVKIMYFLPCCFLFISTAFTCVFIHSNRIYVCKNKTNATQKY